MSKKKGKWKEREVFLLEEDEMPPIEDWQSAKCSECDRYLTTPYHYYFYHYKYCPYCGAKMKNNHKNRKRVNGGC